MRKHQQGMMSLLITSLLLICALLFSLGSSKQVFHQIKRAQNELLSRQAFWAVEGALECAFTELKQETIKPIDSGFSGRCIDLDSNPSPILTIDHFPLIDANEYLLTSTFDDGDVIKTVNKRVSYVGGGILSTIETSASVELTGSQHFVPNKTNNIASDGNYECKSIISGGSVSYVSSGGTDEHFLTTDASVASHAGGPLAAVSFSCNSAYRSNLFDPPTVPGYPSGITVPIKGLDIEENATVDAFKAIFGQNISESDSVKEDFNSDPIGIVIGGGTNDKTSGGWVKNCHNLVANAYSSGKRRIWVDGSCALSGNPFGDKIEKTDDEAVQFVVFDGLLLMEAVSHFNGLIYQYVNVGFNVNNGWLDLFDSNSLIGVSPGGFQRHHIVSGDYDNTILSVRGSVYIDGGVGIDAISRTITINGAIIPSYNKGKSGKHVTGLEWKKGSWHDF